MPPLTVNESISSSLRHCVLPPDVSRNCFAGPCGKISLTIIVKRMHRSFLFILFLFFIEGAHCQTVQDPWWCPHDTITPRGNFVKNVRTSQDSYYVSWGNATIKRNLPPVRIDAASEFPWLVNENENVLILRAGCGMPCWYATILPLDSVSAPFEVDFPLVYDMKNNLVVYSGVKDTIVWVENFLSRLHMPIVGKNCGSAFNFFCTDSVSIVDKQLYLRWMTQYDFYVPSDQKHYQEIRRRINF